MSFLKFHNISIAGVSTSVPKNKIDNSKADFFQNPEEYERFFESTGIATRYAVGDTGICTSDLCYDAAERILENLGWSKDSIDCLIFVTQTPDYTLPATSCILQDRLGLSKSVFALDLSLGCSGWVYGLSVISGLMESGVFKRGLLLAGDTTSITKSALDRSTFPLFGDAGTATAVEFKENAGMTAFDFGTDGSGFESIMIKDGGFRNPTTSSSLIVEEKSDGKIRNDLQSILNGAEVFTFGISQAPKSVKKLLDNLSITDEMVDLYLFHQANRMMNERIKKKLKISDNKMPYSLDEFGNTSSASIILTLCKSNGGKSYSGTVIACGFGVGLSWGSVYFKLEGTNVLDINYI